MPAKNPFKDDIFAEVPDVDPARRIRGAATKLRRLRAQVGADGLSPAAARTLIDEVTAALDACATAIERSEGPNP